MFNNVYYQVRKAIRKGTLIKKPCFCGETKVHAHHEDYSKPLDVIFLCAKHHAHRRSDFEPQLKLPFKRKSKTWHKAFRYKYR